MRTEILLLAVSLTLNVALGVIVVTGVRLPPPAPAKSAAPVAAPAPASAAALDPEVWPRLQTPAAADLVARLRAAGFPTDVIRAILNARFDVELSARLRALDPESSRRPFWKDSQQQPQILAMTRQMRRAHEKQMRTLLGESDDPTTQFFYQALPGRRVDGLPAEKVAAVVEMLHNFEEKRAEFFADPLHTLNPEGRAALEREERAALARLLTPQELEEFDLRNSSIATSMRMELAAFEPTEEEFRAIFRLRNEYSQQYGVNRPSNLAPELARAREEASRRVGEQIQAALGPVRGEEYVRKGDLTYLQTSKIVERLQQPKENVDAVMAVSRDLLARARTVEADRSLPEPARAAQKAALYEEASRRLSPLLGGSTGFDVYRQYGGTWLEAIKPRPAGPAPATTPPRP